MAETRRRPLLELKEEARFVAGETAPLSTSPAGAIPFSSRLNRME